MNNFKSLQLIVLSLVCIFPTTFIFAMRPGTAVSHSSLKKDAGPWDIIDYNTSATSLVEDSGPSLVADSPTGYSAIGESTGRLSCSDAGICIKGKKRFERLKIVRGGLPRLFMRRLISLNASPEASRLVAARIQTRLLREKEFELERSACWRHRRPGVKSVIHMLEADGVDQEVLLKVYDTCYKFLLFGEKCVPGCGNNPMTLLSPERLRVRLNRMNMMMND